MIEENCKAAKRQTVADEIIEMNSNLVERLENLANRIDNQLSRFCNEPSPTDPGKDSVCKSFPPYFDDLRDKAYRINNLIDHIYNTLDRAEL